MAINLTYHVGNNVTVSNTEMSLTVDGGSTTPQVITDAGSFSLWLSGVASMVKGDEFLFKLYEKAHASAAKEVTFTSTLTNVQGGPFTTIPLLLGAGWDMTLIRVSAADRAFYWTIRRVS